MKRWQGLSAMLGSFFRERKVLAGTLVGLFIPAIYCVLYLNAIWDPYGKTNQVPGMIINLDQPATLNGKTLQLGADLTDALLKENKLAWQTGTDAAAALAQLREGKQLIVLEIPGNFSSSVAALAGSGAAQPAPIHYYANQGQSLIVSQLGDRMTELLREQLNDKVAAQVLAELIGTLGQGQSGLREAASGARELQAGAGQLADGAATLSASLERAQQGAEQLAAPVTIDRQPVNPVPNNGTFFAGFFGPMSLWVGAFLFSFLTLMVKWQGWARRSLLPRYALLAVFGTLQALVLDLVLIEGLGMQVNDLGSFMLMTVLTSLSFIAIVHFILAMTGVAGNLIVLVLLVFQLGLSGGSYPLAMLSELNQTLSQWVPLTYAVQGFRIAISGGSSAVLQAQIGHLLLFLAFGLGLHAAYGAVSRLRSRTRRGAGQPLQLSELPE